MSIEQRLRLIQAIEKAGYTAEATEDRGVMILTVWGAVRHVARAVHPCRYDWEEVGRQFSQFQQRGKRTYRTAVVKEAA